MRIYEGKKILSTVEMGAREGRGTNTILNGRNLYNNPNKIVWKARKQSKILVPDFVIDSPARI